jgi:hypothetical protein
MKFTKKAADSSLAYFVNQLDSFDATLHQPLMAVSWGRDVQLRGNVSLANESTSFTRSNFGAGGTQNSTLTNAPAKPFIAPGSTALQGVAVNGERVVTPLRPLARELAYSFIDLQRSQLLGVGIDVQQMEALKMQYQLETDAMVYIGDTSVGAEGMLNSSLVTAANVAAGVGGTTWALKTPDEILADVNTMLSASWLASGYAVCPAELRLPPTQYGLIATKKVSDAGNVSILSYIAENSICNRINGKPLNIQPLKWLSGRGASNTDRMMCYTNDLNYLRFPLVPLQRQTAYYKGIHFLCPYVYGFGEMEFVYPETVRYADGI